MKEIRLYIAELLLHLVYKISPCDNINKMIIIYFYNLKLSKSKIYINPNLVEFLKKENVYDIFMKHTINYHKIIHGVLNIDRISYAFKWDKTDEGSIYWLNLHKKYLRHRGEI